MGFDSSGDFYPLKFDALLRPKRKADGSYAFTWFQLGSEQEAARLGAPAAVASRWTPTEAQLADYPGLYPLTPNFGLRIFATGAKLFVQGTNQGSIEIVPVERDVFVADSVGAEIDFARDGGDKVIALTLKQRGAVLKGERHPETRRARTKCRVGQRRVRRAHQLCSMVGTLALCPPYKICPSRHRDQLINHPRGIWRSAGRANWKNRRSTAFRPAPAFANPSRAAARNPCRPWPGSSRSKI